MKKGKKAHHFILAQDRVAKASSWQREDIYILHCIPYIRKSNPSRPESHVPHPLNLCARRGLYISSIESVEVPSSAFTAEFRRPFRALSNVLLTDRRSSSLDRLDEIF